MSGSDRYRYILHLFFEMKKSLPYEASSIYGTPSMGVISRVKVLQCKLGQVRAQASLLVLILWFMIRAVF